MVVVALIGVPMETDEPQTQGRIVTENPDLLVLLRENTGDGGGPRAMKRKVKHKNQPHSVTEKDRAIRRVYIDSPVSSRTDDEYQFVDPNLDDLDDTQDLLYPEQLAPTGEADPSSERYEDHSSNQMFGASGYKDDRQGVSGVEQKTPPRTQYVVQPKQNSSAHPGIEAMQPHAASGPPTHELPSIIKPIQSPLSKASQQEQEELLVLQQEEEYQQQLRDKIMEHSKKTEQIQIPRLALETLDEDEKKPRPTGYHLHDSLEDEYIVGDSLEVREERSALLKTQHELEQLKQQQMLTQLQLQELQQQQLEYLQAQQEAQQEAQQQAQQQAQHQAQQQAQQQLQQNAQESDALQDSLDQPSGSMAQYYQPEEYPTQQQANQQQMAGASQYYPQYDQPQRGGAHGYPDTQQGYIPNYQSDHLPVGQPAQNIPNQMYPSYQATAQMHGAENPQYYNEDVVYHQKFTTHDSGASAAISPRTNTSSKSSPSRLTQHSTPKPDYIRKNKEELVKGQRQPTYKKLFATKKELKDRPLLPSKLPTPQKGSESGKHADTLQSVEDLWAVRAQRLEQEKQRKVSQGKKRNPLKKYPSESKVNSSPESAASIRSGPPGYGGQRPPHYIQPIQQRRVPLQQSVAEPIRSEVYSEGAVSPGGPIRHTIITEDGQRLSVDIDLKVISPRMDSSQQPAIGQPPHGAELRSHALPSSYQQNPAAFRPHMSVANQKPVNIAPDYPVSPQHQVAAHGYYGGSGATQGYSTNPQTSGYDPAEEYLNQQDAMSHHTASPHPTFQSNTPIASPYKLLPAIGSADTDKGRAGGQQRGHAGTSPGDAGGGSYMAQYKYHQNKKHEYKVYTLEDYRKLKKEVSLGGLGPDIENETIKEKREKRQRQLEYAKSLKQHVTVTTSGRSRSSPARGAEQDDDTLDKRKVALEYAKSVPKPKPRLSGREQASGKSGHRSGATVKSIRQETELEIIDLEKLRQRHEKERQQVALIRQNMENYSQA